MATNKITLIGAADIFGVHPRTIVRALTGDYNAYWYEDSNEDVYAVEDIASVYGMTAFELARCIEGRDSLIKPDEAADILGIPPRTFRNRVRAGRYKKIAHGNIVRYLRSKILEAKIAQE